MIFNPFVSLMKFVTRHNSEKGGSTIELSLVLIPFTATVFFILELLRVSYLSCALDYILLDASRVSVAVSDVPYQKKFFYERFNKLSKILLLKRKGEDYKLSMSYCLSVEEIMAPKKHCEQNFSPEASIIIYAVEYDYVPIFTIFPSPEFHSIFNKFVIRVRG